MGSAPNSSYVFEKEIGHEVRQRTDRAMREKYLARINEGFAVRVVVAPLFATFFPGCPPGCLPECVIIETGGIANHDHYRYRSGH